ncbi:hypothetical protein JCM18750_35130 [Halostagnicola bangensis]
MHERQSVRHIKQFLYDSGSEMRSFKAFVRELCVRHPQLARLPAGTGVELIAPYNPRNAADPVAVEYRIEDGSNGERTAQAIGPY